MPFLRLVRGLGTGAAVWITILGAACEKTNNVDQSVTSDVGDQCGGPGDPGCGVGAVCALGYCRNGCTTDAECQQGAICVGDMPPFGCSLPAEIACSSSQPCAAAGLECGIDGVCRLPCEMDSDCSRNEHHCIAGSCVGDGERDYATWAGCETGANQCDGASFQVCNVTGPGWVEEKNCGEDWCTMPEGRCLEFVVEAGDSDDLSSLTVIDGALYWFNAAGSLLTSSIEPGSTSSVAVALPTDVKDQDRRVNGSLLGLVGFDGANIFARTYRVDGTELMNVDAGADTSNPDRMPRQVMPTTGGMFWIESRPGGTLTTGIPVLVHLALDAASGASPTELGEVAPASETLPAGPFCSIDDTLYFLNSQGMLYRTTAEGPIDGPLNTQAGTDVACRDNDVLVLTTGGVVRIAADGTETEVVQHTFNAYGGGKGATGMVVVGDDILAIDAERTVIAANVVTGEVRTILIEGVQFQAELIAADEEYVFVVMGSGGAPQRIFRTAWK